MMTKIKLITAMTPLAIGPIIGPVSLLYFSMTLGPYDKYQADPSVAFTVRSTYSSTKSAYEIFRFGDNNNPNQQTVTKAVHSVAANGTYTGYVTLPTQSFLGDNGMKITIELYNSNGTRISQTSCYIYPRKPEIINPLHYSNDVYICPQTCANISDWALSYQTESYIFSHIDDYFLTDIYYRLPLEQFVLQTSIPQNSFSYTKAYLKIVGLQEYFPSLTYVSGTATIPLSVKYDNGDLTLALKSALYVEPKLLFMSTSVRQDYALTKNFYLPINHCKDLVGSSFTFGIEGVGYNKSSFIWETALLSENPLIGDCQNSAYCVVGTVTK